MVSLHNCSSSEHWHSGFVMERIPARETGVNKALIPPANTRVCATGPRPSWCWTTSNSSLTSLWGVVTWATPIKQGTRGSQCTESGRRYQGLLAETGVKCSKSRRMYTGQADLRWVGRGLIKMIREKEKRRKPENVKIFTFLLQGSRGQPRTQWVFVTRLQVWSRVNVSPALGCPDNLLLLILTWWWERRKNRQMKKIIIRGGTSWGLACFLVQGGLGVGVGVAWEGQWALGLWYRQRHKD